MGYARHGHSCVGIADTYIMVSGSRKEVSQASQKVELYDTNQDEWMELQNINEGRHYHSSCNFENKFIYIFGGI
jgi:N-acetylneuraminic acid mutarotase